VDQILSLCSGIGGLDLGLHEGLRAVGREPRTVCMVEREAFAVAVLGKAMQEGRLDDCPIWCGDLRELPCDELPAIDWITGGYPCQPFSNAGKRMGEDDPRHLWPAILELVRTLRPGGVFFENVAGHMSLGLDRVLQDLAGYGFRCAFGLFTAEEVGAPHRRERVFILGLADGDGRGLEELGAALDDDRRDARGDDPHRRGPGESGEGDGTGCALGWCEQGDCCVEDCLECGSGRGRCGQATNRFPARPGDRQRPEEPPRTTQPRLGRDADGLPGRVDRLRALGNAVVWQQAARAFETLYKELAC
jgi:DNA (cytosine-5)-methyltransferase 1